MFTNSPKVFYLKLLGFQVSCILSAIGFCTCMLYSLEHIKYDQKIYKNIQICNIDLSGKTLDEAVSIIETQVIHALLNKELSLTLNDASFSIPLHSFYINSDLQEVIEYAIAYSDSLSLTERWQFLSGNETKNFDIQIDFDEESMLAYAEDFINSFNSSPSNADITINNSGKITTVSHSNGQYIDTKQLSSQLTSILESSPYELLMNYTSKSPLMRSASNISNIEINLQEHLNTLTPEIALEDLELINAVISTYTTSFSTSAANATNIKLAADTINGQLLMPGEIFSFNTVVGNTTLDKGYVYAPVIVNSKLTQGVGGGICQVSSTLYNAILLAGLEVTERRPHSKPSSYVPLGQDSTIDWGTIDLKFENTLDYPIYISSFTENGKLHISLYSNKELLGTTYKLSSEIIKVLPYTTNYVKDTSLSPGAKVLVSSGNSGYQVKVTRNSYQNNELVDTEVISHDTYNPVSTVYHIG
ncbi:MAG: VanW family protein [Cellulosilyticum sp.]|nr:VanW family protein [Cellulosilyticum sp.]